MPTFSLSHWLKQVHPSNYLLSTRPSISYLFRVCNPKHPNVMVLQALPLVLRDLNQAPGLRTETNNHRHMQAIESWMPAEHQHMWVALTPRSDSLCPAYGY